MAEGGRSEYLTGRVNHSPQLQDKEWGDHTQEDNLVFKSDLSCLSQVLNQIEETQKYSLLTIIVWN